MRDQKSGVIANFSSMVAWTVVPGGGVYNATKWAMSGLSETLSCELAPFGIRVTSIEPGFFRSNLLVLGHRKQPKKSIPEYDGTAAREAGDILKKIDYKQPGDIAKGSRVIIDVLTQSGSAAGRDIPVRLPLGPDAIKMIGEKCRETLKLLDEWKDILSATNHDDVQ